MLNAVHRQCSAARFCSMSSFPLRAWNRMNLQTSRSLCLLVNVSMLTLCVRAYAVGLLAVQCAQFRGAKRVILIDNAKYRLEFAAQKLPGVELLDFGEHDTVKRLKELVPNGPDVCIEAVGFHYAKSLMSKVEMAVGLQTDPADIINELIISCRKVCRQQTSHLSQHIASSIH